MSIFISGFTLWDFFPSFILAGLSTATADQAEAKRKDLEREITELKENEIERKKVDEQNTFDGDNDSPNEAKSAKELEEWDETIRHSKETVVEIFNWFAN